MRACVCVCAFVHARLRAIARPLPDWFKRFTAWTIANHRRPSSRSAHINRNRDFTNSTLLDRTPSMASSERASIPPQPFATVKQPQPQEIEKPNAVKINETCDVCGKEFSSKTHLRGHFIRNHPFYPYRKRPSQTQCSLKSAQLKNALAMESTKQSQTQPETLTKPGQEKTTTSTTRVVCNICGRKYPNETRLRGHYIRDHPSWPCPIPA